MKLELAVVQSCDEQGCLVRPVGREATVETRYAPAVRNRIRIRCGDLVAVDGATQTPQLVWRWRRGEVLQTLSREPAPGCMLVGARGCAFEARCSERISRLSQSESACGCSVSQITAYIAASCG